MLLHFNAKLCAHLLAAAWLCQEKLNVAPTEPTKGCREEERVASPLPLSNALAGSVGHGHVPMKLC